METPAFVVCWSASEPERVGETARLIPGEHRIGDIGPSDAPPLCFAAERPGAFYDGRPVQHGVGGLSIHASIFGARIRSLGQPARLNGVRMPIGEWHDLAPGDTLYLRDDVLLLFTLRPEFDPLLHFPPHAFGVFGEPDALGIVGESPVVWRWREAVAAAAASAGHVLIHGENGTGKELTARGIHALSARCDGPFVGHVMALDWDLPIRIFGHGENARGVPEEAYPGLLGSMDGGTLLVDHVQTCVSQVALEALDQVLDRGGAYCRFGDATPRQSQFVLLAATNRDPDAVHPLLLKHLRRRVRTPTLAEHPEDIPLLFRDRVRRSREAGAPVWDDVPWFDASGRIVLEARAVERLVRSDYSGWGVWGLDRRFHEETRRACDPGFARRQTR